MKIAVVILHYGQLSTTKECLQNLSKKIGEHQVILINNTHDDCSSLQKIIPRTKLINNKVNLGFARGVNQGIDLAFNDKSITHFFLRDDFENILFDILLIH